jgi:hypothetical protein
MAGVDASRQAVHMMEVAILFMLVLHYLAVGWVFSYHGIATGKCKKISQKLLFFSFSGGFTFNFTGLRIAEIRLHPQ